MKILSVDRLNKLLESSSADVTELAEKNYETQLEAAAKLIAENALRRPVVLLSGPSGSSKTTTAFRLKTLLGERGIKAHAVSLDNYFLPLDGLSEEQKSRLDLESPERLDMPLLTDHLERFCRCEEVCLPAFDFATQSRGKGSLFLRQENEPVIIEGIHALNPAVTGCVSRYSIGIYVSVRTRLALGERLLHPEKIRLLRRLIRDSLFRGRSAEETILAFDSVQLGEQRYIMPYKTLAQAEIDTFMSFEAAVYGYILDDTLKRIDKTFSHYDIVQELTDFLTSIRPLPPEAVAEGSIIREFIGG